MDDNLQHYLNDHLAGAAGAVELISSIAAACDLPDEREFFADLKLRVEDDRSILCDLIAKIGQARSELLQVAGDLTLQASKLKLRWKGMAPGEMGFFEALEILSLGIQGKRLLWVVLAELQPSIPEWKEFDFKNLELTAIAQRDAVEDKRVPAAVDSLLDRDRRRYTPSKL